MSFGFVAFDILYLAWTSKDADHAINSRPAPWQHCSNIYIYMLPTGHVHSANVWLHSKFYNLLQHVSTAWQQAVEHPELQNLNLHAPCLDPPLLCLEVHNVFRICLRIVKDSKDGCSESLRKDSPSLTCDCISAFGGQPQPRPTNAQPA